MSLLACEYQRLYPSWGSDLKYCNTLCVWPNPSSLSSFIWTCGVVNSAGELFNNTDIGEGEADGRELVG